MYFAVLGKHPEISKAELELVQPQNISYPKKWIIIFDTEHPELLQQLGGIIKAGRVVKEKELPTLLADTKIIGIQSETNGKHLKRTAGIRRYKLVDLFHTDREIKTKGKEIINLENGLYGIVEHYQNIELYEAIDFDKPGRSMQMGMMPAKLTHIMLNIWLHSLKSIKSKVHKAWLSTFDFWLSTVIYDPFVGSWTTGFLANHLGYEFIGSDIKTTYAEQNAKRRMTTKFATTNKELSIFTHDIKKKLEKSSLFMERGGTGTVGDFKKETKMNVLIITEWWLGPIVTKSTSDQDIQKFQERVADLYKNLLDRIKDLWATAVFTIPRYIGHDNGIQKILEKYATDIWLHTKEIPELYSREGQQIARKILIIT